MYREESNLNLHRDIIECIRMFPRISRQSYQESFQGYLYQQAPYRRLTQLHF